MATSERTITMSRYQANRLARKACLQLMKWGWTVDLDQIKGIVNRRITRVAKSNNTGNQKTKSEMAAEMAKDILLSMGDKLNYPDNYQEQDFAKISLSDKVQRILGSPVFGVSHILNWPRFISKLSEEIIQDAPSLGKTIYHLLPDEMKSLVNRSTIRPPKQTQERHDILPDSIKSLIRIPLSEIRIETQERRDFIDALNEKILDQRDLYKEQDYPTEDLPDSVQELLGRRQDLPTHELQKLNRLLIEAAFPVDIAPSQYLLDNRDDLPLREIQTLNRLLIESAYPDAIVRHEEREREIDIVTRDHDILWWVYQAREASQFKTYRREQALRELFNELIPFFEGSDKEEIFDTEEHSVLTSKDILERLEFACWRGIKSFSSEKNKTPSEYINTNHLAYTRRKIGGRGKGSAKFLLREIKHWQSFLYELNAANNYDLPNPGKRICMLLSDSTRELIEVLDFGVDSIHKDHKAEIIKALNEILKRYDFYQEEYFGGLFLPEEVEEKLEHSEKLSVHDIQWLNRTVIEEAFPYDIEKKEQEKDKNKTIRLSDILATIAKKLDDDISLDLADIHPELSVDFDMRQSRKEEIRRLAHSKINFSYDDEEKRKNLLIILDRFLDQAFSGATPTVQDLQQDDSIDLSQSSLYNYVKLFKDILDPIIRNQEDDENQKVT